KVKMIKDREVLFDEDRNGIPFFSVYGYYAKSRYWAEFSLIGACISQEFEVGSSRHNVTLGDPLIFEPSLKFVSGEELLVYVTFYGDSPRDIAADTIDLAAIMKVKVS
ncbi:unnamed protein product, partial [marine sediment metagenome]